MVSIMSFLNNKLPKTFRGLRVIDGDKTDMRFLDGNKRVVVGLKAKGDAKTDTSGFVINWKLTTSERRRLNYGVQFSDALDELIKVMDKDTKYQKECDDLLDEEKDNDE